MAHDDSPKANEALYLATYIAGRWDIPLVVVTVQERGRVADRALRDAESYLERHEIQPTTILKKGVVAISILETAVEHDCELVLMGDYGHTLAIEMVLGSAANQVLANSQRPVLISR